MTERTCKISISGVQPPMTEVRVGDFVIWERPKESWRGKRNPKKTRAEIVQIHDIGEGWNDVDVLTGMYVTHADTWELRTFRGVRS